MRKSDIRKTNVNKRKQYETEAAEDNTASDETVTAQPATEVPLVPVAPKVTFEEPERQAKTTGTANSQDDPYRRIYSGAIRKHAEEGRSLRKKRARALTDAEFESAIAEHEHAISQEEPSQQVAEASCADSMDIDIAGNEETEGRSTRSGIPYAALEQEQQMHTPVMTLDSIAAGEEDKGISANVGCTYREHGVSGNGRSDPSVAHDTQRATRSRTQGGGGGQKGDTGHHRSRILEGSAAHGHNGERDEVVNLIIYFRGKKNYPERPKRG